MAFNFNWSPLTADADFYARARDLLTNALNKSPKPPIIVDDILVSELNLGTVPPDLEILEIGDLAEDRFRGIFKMCYTGDAFLTLKTRVQVRRRSMPPICALPSSHRQTSVLRDGPPDNARSHVLMHHKQQDSLCISHDTRFPLLNILFNHHSTSCERVFAASGRIASQLKL